MARKQRDSAGGAYEKRGKFFMRLTIAAGRRRAEVLPWCTCIDDAKARATAVQAQVNRLRRAGDTDFAEKLIESAAKGDEEKLAMLTRIVDGIVGGQIEKRPEGDRTDTFKAVLLRWTSGELARDFPDHVAKKRSAKMDGYRATHIADALQELPVTSWRGHTYEGVMAGLAPGLSSSSRRQVAQLMHRVLQLAVYPLKLIPSNPIVRGMLPRVTNQKELAALFPDDVLLVARNVDGVDLGYRVLWSFLAENGWRISEAVGDEKEGIPPLRWRDVRFEHGFARLLRTKTGGAVKVPLDPSVLDGLRAWRTISTKPAPEDRVFVGSDGQEIALTYAAEVFRDHLKLSGLTREQRPELFPEGDELLTTKPVRVHELRSLFVCSSLADGRTDTWVRQRTGHRTPSMLDAYRRQQHIYETLAPVLPMVQAVPEVAAAFEATKRGGTFEVPDSVTTFKAPESGGFRRRDSNPNKRIQSSYYKVTSNTDDSESSDNSKIETTSENGEEPGPPHLAAPIVDHVEMALAGAIEGAARAGEWSTVAQLVRELEARRSAKVTPLAGGQDRDPTGSR